MCAAFLVAASLALNLPNIGDKSVAHATDAEAVTRWLDEHCASPRVLGFDTETRPSYRKGQVNPPAVVQLSTADACLVAQIFVARSRSRGSGSALGAKGIRQLKEESAMASDSAAAVRAALKATLEDRSIIKAGVGIDDDAIELWQSWGLELNSRLELGGGASNNVGLARLLNDATGITLVKSASVQKSDWSAALTDKQLAYAAADAWAGRAIYERLNELQPDTFGYEPISQLLAQEPACSHLWAFRVARKATRAAVSELAADLEESARIPTHRGDANESRRLAQQALKKLSKARTAVAKSLAPSGATTLPVYSVLEQSPLRRLEEEAG